MPRCSSECQFLITLFFLGAASRSLRLVFVMFPYLRNIILLYMLEKSENPEILAPAYECIRKNYARPLTVEELARECCLSKYYFLRQFKQSCGETPYQYLTRHRIEMAKTLLADTDLPMNVISAKVGYANYGNFLVHFKKMTDMNPSQYREKRK